MTTFHSLTVAKVESETRDAVTITFAVPQPLQEAYRFRPGQHLTLKAALKRGADGYLLKDMEPEDLLKALHQAAAGEMVLSEALTPVLAASLRANRATTERDVNQLTPRERDILKLIAQGLPNKMIARRLDITESTVKVHVKHMLKKMKLKSRVEAAVWVHQERIF